MEGGGERVLAGAAWQRESWRTVASGAPRNPSCCREPHGGNLRRLIRSFVFWPRVDSRCKDIHSFQMSFKCEGKEKERKYTTLSDFVCTQASVARPVFCLAAFNPFCLADCSAHPSFAKDEVCKSRVFLEYSFLNSIILPTLRTALAHA